MADLVRLGVSISSDLLTRFDEIIKEKGYVNRSEAIRSLVLPEGKTQNPMNYTCGHSTDGKGKNPSNYNASGYAPANG